MTTAVAKARRRAARHLRETRRLAALAARRPRAGAPRAHYALARLPAVDEPVSGGLVKLQRLATAFPDAPADFNLLYLSSNTLPLGLRRLLWLARRKGIPVVWNQNGVAYPGWHGPGWERLNEPMALGLHAADHVLYQSEFCRRSADRFLGPRAQAAEVLHNAVDTRVFTPAPEPPPGLTLLLGGDHQHPYRVEAALRTVELVARERPDVRLLVAGRTLWRPGAGPEAARALGVEGLVEFTGPYVQRDAPALLRRAHLLLHTQYNDACPTLVIDALACGLPVVHSASGGVPELVGGAGIGISAPESFEEQHPPAPESLAEAVLRVAGRLPELAAAARGRAVERFDLAPWLERHREVFEKLLR